MKELLDLIRLSLIERIYVKLRSDRELHDKLHVGPVDHFIPNEGDISDPSGDWVTFVRLSSRRSISGCPLRSIFDLASPSPSKHLWPISSSGRPVMLVRLVLDCPLATRMQSQECEKTGFAYGFGLGCMILQEDAKLTF
ncbi:hypothetical protein FEM48_Zijuj09G0156000 [Ziziphus jujuba var. spinosa]|uniref:Uncharacterized protein n=1 Tax=Ziziphus jujuba var. spinosa TaxID=714518 RepID=A0A978UTU2_ZIZJJ|nr:hypothetical protein FEM48_Zijuj09G0156000 [Ziziphus jujuba var. spinosa]